MESFGKLCFIILSIALSVTLGAFVTIRLWEWFIIPIFSLKTIGYPAAIGLSTFISLVKGPAKKYDDDEEFDIKKTANAFMRLFSFYLMILLIGWIASLFM